MAWKGVHLTKAGRLSLADGQCCVKQDEGEVRIAIEDLAWIVIDTPQATVTSALLAACMDAGVVVVITDARHAPSGLALPFHCHHRQRAMRLCAMNSTMGKSAGKPRRN
jgi:CRISP-associated protein Cas1